MRAIIIRIRPAASGSFTTLTPRQPLLATPHATFALTAAVATTATTATCSPYVARRR